jgi:hypothetical protein
MVVEIEVTHHYGQTRRKLNTQALEVGDWVAVLDEGGYNSRGAIILTVERLTAKQIIMAGRSLRYYRENGGEVGGNRHFCQLHAVDSPRVIAALQRAALRVLLRSTDELARRKPSSHEERVAIAMELAESAAAAAERMRALEASANPDHDTW